MAQVKLELGDLSREQVADKADTVVTAMTGNPNFTTPNPPLATITTAKATLRAKIAAIAAAKNTLTQTITEADAAKDVVVGLLTQEGGYVQTTSGGNPAIILSSGMGVVSAGSPIHMTQVLDLAIREGDNPGSVTLNWKPGRGARSYEIQTTTDPNNEASWTLRDTSTKSSATLTGLTSGTRIWVRVRAVGANDKGGWSDAAGRIVP